MTERERLYELIVDADNEFFRETPYGTAQERIEKTVEHLLANGVLLLPCKVGDTVYAYSEDFFTILPYFVENVNVGYIDESRNYIVYEANCHADETDELLDEIDFDFDDFGKTVFLTREEAEAELKKRRKEVKNE
jgi:hypothetical protein